MGKLGNIREGGKIIGIQRAEKSKFVIGREKIQSN
jgi:hypothetical protein